MNNRLASLSNSAENSEKPVQHAYLIFTVVSLALLMASIDSTIIAVGIPALLADLKTNLAMVGWTITGFQFSQSVIMPIMGKLSDDLGRKKVFLVSVVIFTLSSLAAGLAPNIIWLIIFRVVQGIGGGAFLPSCTGIISDTFSNRRATAIGLFGSIFPIGGIIGPNIGGFILDNLSWRWMFFVNIPFGLALIIMGLKYLPGNRMVKKYSEYRVDVIGMSLFIGAILAVLFAITNWASSTNTGIFTWLLLATGSILFIVFIVYEDRVEEPMIETKLLRLPPFLAVNIYNFIFGIVVFGLVTFIPYYATVAYGTTAGQNGLLLTPRSIMMIIVSAITSFFIIRFRYRSPMIIGTILISISLFLLGQGFRDLWNINNLLLLIIIVAISGIGMGLANPAANNAALDLAPEKAAAMTGMRGMARSIGGLIGVAMVTLILSYYPDQAKGMREIYTGFAISLLLLIPIVFLIPDTAKQKKIKRN